jgi:tetratricopeptide (TPR) repeat protein
VADGGSLWAQSFDLRAADVFVLQDEVAQRVAQHLRRTLSVTEQARLAKRYTSNPEAYAYYVKGKEELDKWNVSRAELEAAVGKFKQAIELDSQYALALAQLAYCYARIALFYEWNPFWFEQAKQTLTQADRLDPNLAESHVVRAF